MNTTHSTSDIVEALKDVHRHIESLAHTDQHCGLGYLGDMLSQANKRANQLMNALLDTDKHRYSLCSESEMNRPGCVQFDFGIFMSFQEKWSSNVFGPGVRTKELCDHIRKELAEIEAAPDDLIEWADVIILALDGAWRSGYTARDILNGLIEKQSINMDRKWPKPEEGRATEHIR